MTAPRVSIVIPTLNALATLPAVHAAIAAQRTTLAWELLVIDSSSTDGTVEWLKARGIRVEVIPRRAFNHGTTRNRAIEMTRGEFVALLSQDAVPVGAGWLEALVQPLLARPQVAGTFARQVPRDEAGAIARYYLSRWIAGGTEGRSVRLADAGALERLDPVRRHDACAFDNVCSCIRRSVWASIPFDAVPIAEDLAWARAALRAGHELVFTPAAAVTHSHDRSVRYELSRTITLHRQLVRLFGLRTVPSLAALAFAWAATLRLHLALVGRATPRRPADGLARAVALAFVWPLGQYLGGRTARARAGHGGTDRA